MAAADAALYEAERGRTRSSGLACQNSDDKIETRASANSAAGWHSVSAIIPEAPRSKEHQLSAWAISILRFTFFLVALDHSIFNVDHAVSIFRDVMLVGDQHDRVAFAVQAVKQCHDFASGL